MPCFAEFVIDAHPAHKYAIMCPRAVCVLTSDADGAFFSCFPVHITCFPLHFLARMRFWFVGALFFANAYPAHEYAIMRPRAVCVLSSDADGAFFSCFHPHFPAPHAFFGLRGLYFLPILSQMSVLHPRVCKNVVRGRALLFSAQRAVYFPTFPLQNVPILA